jgi:hypothetical protein
MGRTHFGSEICSINTFFPVIKLIHGHIKHLDNTESPNMEINIDPNVLKGSCIKGINMAPNFHMLCTFFK